MENIIKIHAHEILEALGVSESDWNIAGLEFDSISWVGDAKTTKAEWDAKRSELEAEYDSLAYSRNRASAYDSVGDQLDMVMKDMRDGTTTHKDACEAVKAKYPKPE